MDKNGKTASISENFQSFDMNIFAKLKSFPRTRFFTPYIWNGIKNSTLVLYEQAKTVSRIFRFREIPDVANIVPVYTYLGIHKITCLRSR